MPYGRFPARWWWGGTLSGVVYTYDNRGNRLSAGSEVFTYDDRNRLTSDGEGTYEWSVNGLLETFDPVVGPDEDYSFDAGTRLVGVTDGTTTTSYSYDSLDRLTARDSVGFTYNGGSLDPTSIGTDTIARTPAGTPVNYGTTGGGSFPLLDAHHDLVGLISADGTVTDTRTYSPSGETVAQTGSTDLAVGFQSDFTDPDSGHVWMGARWYQPSTATFLSRDTYSGQLSTPFSLNRYTYGLNNPVNYWDPTGRCGIMANVDGLGCGSSFGAREDAGDYSYNDGQGSVYTYDYAELSWKLDSYTPNSATEQSIISVLANEARASIITGRLEGLEELRAGGFLPAELDHADVWFVITKDYGLYAQMVDALVDDYQEHLRQGYVGSMAAGSVQDQLLVYSNFVRCEEGIGPCYQAASGKALVVEVLVSFGAGVACGLGAAAAAPSAGVSAAVGCGVAAAVLGGAAGNWAAGRSLTDGLIVDAVIGGATAGIAHSVARYYLPGTTGTNAPTSALDDLASIRTTVSPQRQGRHLAGDPLYNGGGYLNSLDDAQGVLSAFHDGSANVLGVTRQGHVVVEVPSITGFNVNIRHGFIDQPTSVFIIKGSSSPSVVPTNPLWTAGS